MIMSFEEQIKPFGWYEGEEQASLTLDTAIAYLEDVFAKRSEEGFLGNGYDWESLAAVFLEEKCDPNLAEKLEFDSEAGMFCIYSNDKEALKEFAFAFHQACQDPVLIEDLFSRAELL